LNADPTLPPYSWNSPDGVSIAIDGPNVQVDWTSAPDASAQSWERMEGVVEDHLLVENLETRAALSVRWTERELVGAPRTSFSLQAQGWISRRPRQRLDLNAAKATIVERCPEVRRAIQHLRTAMEMLHGDGSESMGRL